MATINVPFLPGERVLLDAGFGLNDPFVATVVELSLHMDMTPFYDVEWWVEGHLERKSFHFSRLSRPEDGRR